MPTPRLARVRYEFRDPTGRTIGQPTAIRPTPATAPATDPPPGTDRSGREPPDEPVLEWATDPITGMRVPAFFLEP